MKRSRGRYGPNQPPRCKVTVEYDSRGQRAARQFDSPVQARQFYAAKLKAGRNPKVRAVKE